MTGLDSAQKASQVLSAKSSSGLSFIDRSQPA